MPSASPIKSVLKAGPNRDVNVYVPASDLTVKQIQDQIPAKYFVRSTSRGLMYLARDIAQLLLAYYLMYTFVCPVLELFSGIMSASPVPAALSTGVVLAVKFATWNVFWIIQGLSGTGLWVLAHECGHQAFSPSRQLNDTIGLICHSAILVPYHSWRITHGNHHKHTNHLTKDTVFVPRKENKIIELAEETPLVQLFWMIVMFVFGWPAYLLFNVASQDYSRRANHFERSSPLFRPDDAQDIIASDLGVLATLTMIGVAVAKFGAFNVFCWYGVPYLWVNFWLIYITYLQHSDIRIPHYSHEEWTFTRGAIAAVDRSYGWLLNSWLHHINDSHVVHHIFSQMPFYHAIEVTRKHIREIIGDTYVEDDSPLIEALCKCWKECRYVVPAEGVSVFYGASKVQEENVATHTR